MANKQVAQQQMNPHTAGDQSDKIAKLLDAILSKLQSDGHAVNRAAASPTPELSEAIEDARKILQALGMKLVN